MAVTVALPGSGPVPYMAVTAGVLDDDARYAYTNGQCHAFALALHAAVGGELIWAGSDRCLRDDDWDCPHEGESLPTALLDMFDVDCPCQIDHLMVKLGDEYLDIDGAWDETTLLTDRFIAIGDLLDEEAAALAGLSTWCTPDHDTAATFIAPYLAWLHNSDPGQTAD